MTAVVIGVVAVLVVLATSLLKNVEWSDKAKNLIATVLSVVGGVATVFATGGFVNATDVLTISGLVYAASQLIYTFIFKGFGLNTSLENVRVFGKNSAPAVDPAAEFIPDDVAPEDVNQG